ncbi:hypothetical protein X963_5103 [Burkholderia pseudomallei MSHR7498]|nr:hypothetical protein DP56_1549 [Burkholderia pseudomallei]KGS92661.1 hypothetical protein X963_5103 [Burkholderia pseudomallei MSHR7498]
MPIQVSVILTRGNDSNRCRLLSSSFLSNRLKIAKRFRVSDNDAQQCLRRTSRHTASLLPIL